MAVGVVEGDCLAVFGEQRLVFGGGERLPEGGAVLEREAGFAERVARRAPSLAARALVAFVHENQIVALERLHRDADAPAALLVRQLGYLRDLHDAGLQPHRPAFVQIQPNGGDVGRGEVVQMLAA